RRANYTANFSKCLRPLSGVREPRALQPVPGVRPIRRCCAVETARSWRAIVPFTHLAREGRMTVTIGRRELIAALGGAAAWARAASGDAGDWCPWRHLARRMGAIFGCIRSRPKGGRLHRGPERQDRIPVGG